MSYTLLDAAKLVNGSAEIGIIDEVQQRSPEFQVFPVRTIPGYSYKTTVRTGRPSVAFREVNGGISSTASTFELRETSLFPISSLITVDKALVALTGGNMADLEMDHATQVYEEALKIICTQVFRGTSADAKGFAGIQSLTPHTATAGTSTQVVNAAGTTATTASSVYALRLGLQDVHLVFGGNTTLQLTPFRDELYSPASGSGQVDGRVATLTAWVGMQVANLKSIGRIYNLTEDSGKGLTDARLAALWAKFPPGHKPNVFFASTRSLRQLQESRTVVLNSGPSAKPTGAYETIAPWPTEYMGIPIIETQNIPDTDAINA